MANMQNKDDLFNALNAVIDALGDIPAEEATGAVRTAYRACLEVRDEQQRQTEAN